MVKAQEYFDFKQTYKWKRYTDDTRFVDWRRIVRKQEI